MNLGYVLLSYIRPNKNIFGSKKIRIGFQKVGDDDATMRLSKRDRGVGSIKGKRETEKDMRMLMRLWHKKEI